ncbi:hypothetical protein AB0J57_00520 [Streptomyces sp. NPDC049837]|uniref:hypothetical protein n=1 Tax=Streptomyces sp. NPDC049837 TaxID=3155277 RepID=UPI00341F0FBD
MRKASGDDRDDWGTLLDIVVDKYERAALDLEHIRRQVDAVTGLLERGGFRRQPGHRQQVPDLRFRELHELIGRLRFPTGMDRLLVYWAGHGREEGERGLFLLCSDTESEPGPVTELDSIRPGFLGTQLARSGARDIVLVLDACGAGGGADDVVTAFRRMAAGRRTALDPSLVVIGAARSGRRAEERALSEALRTLLEDEDEKVPVHRGWGPRDQWITVDELTKALKSQLGPGQPLDVVTTGVIDTAFFPNPRYNPELPDTDLERRRGRPALLPADVREHFMLKFRGIDTADDSGYFFQGRTGPLRAIVEWLRTEDSGMFVVTGPPGSGKSALLGRLAVLSDAHYRRAVDEADPHAVRAADPGTLPDVGDIDVGIHARGKDVLDCVTELARALRLKRPRGGWRDPDQLIAAIGRSNTEFTVLIDALDEAGPNAAGAIAEHLLRPLADQVGVKVLVGTRQRAVGADSGPRSLISILAPHRLVRLDQDADTTKDIETYAYKRLTDLEGSPYCLADDELTRRAAQRVARESESVFLMARLFTRALACRDDLLDLNSAEADEIFRSRDVAEVFAADLARYGTQRQKMHDLLAPLAWAQGPGLPKRTVWAAAATALADGATTYTADDVAWAITEAGAHLIETGEDGQGLYRLYHQAYVDHLRRTTATAGRTPALLYEAVLGTVPRHPDGRRDWPRANPYVLSHLPDYARAAGRLHHLVHETGILPYADPARLMRVLNTPEQQRLPLPRLYLRVWDELRDLPPEDRAATLQLRAGIEEPDALPHLKTGAQLRWRVLWGHGRRTNFHGVLAGGPTSAVGAVAIDHDPDGALTVAAGADDGSVHVWDGVTGELLRTLPVGSAPVTSVELARVKGRLLLAAASDRQVRLWDCTAGWPLRTHQHRRKVTAMAFSATADGEGVLATASRDGRIHVWSVERDEALQTWPGGGLGTRSLALTVAPGGGNLLIAAHTSGRVSAWDLGRSADVPVPSRAWRTRHRPVRARHGIAVVELEGRSMVVGSGRRFSLEGLQYVDLTTGEPTVGDDKANPPPSDGFTPQAIGWVKDAPAALVAGDREGRVRLGRGGGVVDTWTGHSGDVRSVAGVRSGSGDFYAVSGSKDGTVRLWNTAVSDAERAEEHGDHEHHTTSSDLFSHPDGRVLLATGSDEGTVRIRDGRTGRLIARCEVEAETHYVPNFSGDEGANDIVIREVESGHDLGVTGVRWVPPAGQGRHATLFSGSRDGSVQIWSEKGKPQRRSSNSSPVTVMAARGPGVGSDGRFVAAGRTNGTFTIHTCDRSLPALRRIPRIWPLRGHRRRIKAAAFARLADGTSRLVSADNGGRIRLWEWPSGRLVGELHGPGGNRKAHQGPVHSLAAAFGSEGPTLISAGEDGLRVWDLASRSVWGDLGSGPAQHVAALSTADGRVLVAASTPERAVEIWDARAKTRFTTVRGFRHKISTVSMVRDVHGSGTVLLAVGSGLTIHVLELLEPSDGPHEKGTP